MYYFRIGGSYHVTKYSAFNVTIDSVTHVLVRLEENQLAQRQTEHDFLSLIAKNKSECSLMGKNQGERRKCETEKRRRSKPHQFPIEKVHYSFDQR